ncbi:MAG: AraC family transcriptional regulator [Melioribacteraceae bacterium]
MKKKDGFIGEFITVLPKIVINEAQQNPIISSLFTTDIGYFPHAKEHFRERLEGCEQNILIYCVEGKGWVEVSGKKNLVGSNEFFIIPAYTPHRYGADENDPWSIYWLHFNGNKAHLFRKDESVEINYLDNIESSRFKERIFLFQEIFENLQPGLTETNLEYAATCLWHLLGSFRYVAAYRKIKQVKNNGKIEKSIYYMNEQIERNIPLHVFASQCGLSLSHYCLTFKKHTSYSPLEYFTRLKIQKACNMLDLTGKIIKEIAHSLGFEDQYYFTRVFTKIMGVPPTKYRERKKG